MQVVLNKKEKKKLVIKLHQEGKTIRQIAHEAHASFTDIGKVIRKINGVESDNIHQQKCEANLKLSKP